MHLPQVDGELTEIAVRPPETAVGLDEGAVRDVLDHLADTSSVTGANLFRLLVVKVHILIVSTFLSFKLLSRTHNPSH